MQHFKGDDFEAAIEYLASLTENEASPKVLEAINLVRIERLNLQLGAQKNINLRPRQVVLCPKCNGEGDAPETKKNPLGTCPACEGAGVFRF